MEVNMKKESKFKTPHTFVILVALIFIAAVATYFIPAGEFTRYVDEATGRTLVEAGSYTTIESNPINFFNIPSVIYRAMVKSAEIMMFIIVVGASFEIITSTNALTALCKRISKSFRGKELFVIPTFLIIFSILGFTMGMSSEVMIFVPIGITLAYSLGLDKVTGTAMITMGAASGFTAGLLNPFNVGVAQAIAEVPMFSGIGFRVVILVVLLIADSAYIIWYAKRVKKDPSKSIIYGIEEVDEYKFDDKDSKITKSQIAVLIIMVIGFGVLIYGLMKLDWYFEEMAGIFIAMGVISGLVSGMEANKIASTFGKGAAGVITGALIVGVARGVEVVLTDAMILDTIVNAIANLVGAIPQSIQAVGMFISQSLVNCVITSGTGQAAVTMPLMVPVADLVGISRQTAVLAFQLGDGFSNSILPTSSALMGYLVVSKIPYAKWLKFMVPLFLIWTALGCIFMLIAVGIGY